MIVSISYYYSIFISNIVIIIKILLTKNIIKIEDFNNHSINYFFEKGKLKIIEFLYKNYNIDINQCENLVISCKYGHLDLVKFLIENGTDINTMDTSPLLKSIENGHIDIVEYLIYKGVNIRSYYLFYFQSILYNQVSLINFFSTKIDLNELFKKVELKKDNMILY